MADKKTTPPAADPRAGRNAGYAENQPRDPQDAQQRSKHPPKPNPDEPGIDRDTDEQPDPTSDREDKSRH